MPELRRSPLTGILHGLRTFIIGYCLAVFFGELFSTGYTKAYGLPLLALGLCYAAAYVAAEMIKNNGLSLLTSAASCALGIFMMPGMALGVPVSVRRSAVGYIVCLAVLLVASFIYRSRLADDTSARVPAIVTVLLPISLYTVAYYSSLSNDLAAALYYCSLLYVIACVAVGLADSSSEQFEHMRGKVTQPLSIFRKRLSFNNILIIALLSVILFSLPSVHFPTSILLAAFRFMFLALLSLLRMLDCSSAVGDDFPEEIPDDMGLPDEAVSDGNTLWADILISILFIFIVSGILVVIIRAVKRLAAAIRDYFTASYERSKDKVIARSAYDTIESIGIVKNERKKKKRTAGETNAEKVRQIYKKRVSSVLRQELNELASKAPDEIAQMAEEKGYDISELTKVYKKARYTDRCEKQDVSDAKNAKAEKLRS